MTGNESFRDSVLKKEILLSTISAICTRKDWFRKVSIPKIYLALLFTIHVQRRLGIGKLGKLNGSKLNGHRPHAAPAPTPDGFGEKSFPSPLSLHSSLPPSRVFQPLLCVMVGKTLAFGFNFNPPSVRDKRCSAEVCFRAFSPAPTMDARSPFTEHRSGSVTL